VGAASGEVEWCANTDRTRYGAIGALSEIAKYEMPTKGVPQQVDLIELEYRRRR
jgi:hypothetical protein